MEKISLGTVLHLSKGKKPSAISNNQTENYLPYVDIKAFEKGIVDNYASPEKCLLCKDGEVLIVCDGARAGLVGKAISGIVGSTLAIITVAGCSNDYLFYFLQSIYTLLNTQQKGTGTPHINPEVIKNLTLRIPPLAEQERIVAKIEELFSELDSAVAELKNVKGKLQVYRQAVLKEAFDSASCNNIFSSIDQLLSQSKKGMTTGPFGTMLNKSEHKTSGLPVLGIENIGDGKFIPGNKIFISSEKAKELDAFKIFPGDIIISRSGTVGEICVVPDYIGEAYLSTNLIKVSLNNSVIRSDYFVYLFQSKGIVLDQVKEICKGSTRLFLNQTILKQIKFPVPSLAIQQEIVEKIEYRLSECDNIEQTVNTALQQAAALRQSILKQAFEGKL